MNAATAGASVLALAASDVRPAVGETVRLFASYAGEWPAAIVWDGVDEETGLEATVTPRAPGLLTVRAGGATLVLDVQPMANVGTSVIHPLVRSLPSIDAGACRDDRYPALAGDFVVGCSPSGRVDRAVSLMGSRDLPVALSDGIATPGLGPAAVLAPPAGLWRLPDSQPVSSSFLASEPIVGVPATDGAHVAMAWPRHVEAWAVGDATRLRTEAAPLPGQPVALAWPWAAWVEGGGPTREDIWARNAEAQRVPLSRTARSERLPAGSGRWIGWVDEGGVYVQDTTRGERRVYPADTGFVFGPSLWGPVACWEDRGALRTGAGDIDILCSDGVELRRPGNQRAPSRWGPWILFREGEHLLFGTVPELILDDDDPRADGAGATVEGGWGGAHREGAVSYTFDWPAPGWRVERWEGAWVPGEALGVGLVTLTHPGGDAVRLVPEAP
jgi:hypothetical protein